MIKALIVDDSKVVREFLTEILRSDPEISVVGIAIDGKEAVSQVKRLQPDVVLMDIHMPHKNGFEATQEIMETAAVPIVIVSGSYENEDTYKSFKAMEVGALAIVKKPAGQGHPNHEKEVKELLKYVKLMSEVKVITRWHRYKNTEVSERSNKSIGKIQTNNIKVVAIGASTGGPAIIEQILAALTPNFPLPILIVQHMSTGFVESFVTWLGISTGFNTKLAQNGERLQAGCAYFAPDDYHIQVDENKCISLNQEAAYNGLRPTVGKLFKSVVDVYGQNAIGVLLTGMGSDGAAELKLMRDAGAVTIAQDQESSVVFGMPGEAIKLEAAKYILDPQSIAQLIKRLTKGG